MPPLRLSLPSFIAHNSALRRSPLSAFLPVRALVKKKAKPAKSGESSTSEPSQVRYVPYLPPSAVSDTVVFFENKDKLRNLLDLIYSPKDPCDTMQDREQFQREFESYLATKQAVERAYRKHEEAAYVVMQEAIHNLPKDLYEEAVQSEDVPLPQELQFHYLYRKELLDSKLTPYEKKKLQAFQNLIYLRFPHAQLKKKSPHLFWIRESQAISRQQQLKNRASKKKK